MLKPCALQYLYIVQCKYTGLPYNICCQDIYPVSPVCTLIVLNLCRSQREIPVLYTSCTVSISCCRVQELAHCTKVCCDLSITPTSCAVVPLPPPGLLTLLLLLLLLAALSTWVVQCPAASCCLFATCQICLL